jgi:biotin carboxylase
MVLIMGMARRGEFESLEKRGLRLGILVDSNNTQRLGDVSRFVAVERFDFSRPLPELIGVVRALQQRWGLACLLNLNELYVAHTAEVATALGLPGVSPGSARLSLDKNPMRCRFAERLGPGTSARFRVVTAEDDLLKGARELGFPVVLQPTNVSASMWATRNDTPAELLENYRAVLREVPAHYRKLGQKDKQLTVVIAEYLEGLNTSIDCLVDVHGKVSPTPVVDVVTGADLGINDFHHFARLLPSRLSAAEQGKLTRLAVAGVEALDLCACATHVEFIGPRLGEIAARPGGNRPRILEVAYGLDELHAYYQVLTGRAPNLERAFERAAAVVTPFPVRTGTLGEIRHLERVPRLPGYLYHEVRAQQGQPVGPARSGFRAPLYIELQSDSADEVRRSVDEIALWSDLYVVQ